MDVAPLFASIFKRAVLVSIVISRWRGVDDLASRMRADKHHLPHVVRRHFLRPFITSEEARHLDSLEVTARRTVSAMTFPFPGLTDRVLRRSSIRDLYDRLDEIRLEWDGVVADFLESYECRRYDFFNDCRELLGDGEFLHRAQVVLPDIDVVYADFSFCALFHTISPVGYVANDDRLAADLQSVMLKLERSQG